tara:strand:- start:2594 stop:3538 length:945 start_codon:yes stop_codon:yes gene_type:complete
LTDYRTPYFPPEITEDRKFYYLKIHPEERQIAKDIQFRQWNGEIKKWVFPKKISVYKELVEKLKTKAKFFKITEPQDETKANANGSNKSSILTDDQITELWQDFKRLPKQEQNDTSSVSDNKSLLIEEKLEEFSESINFLKTSLSSQSEKLDSLLENNNKNNSLMLEGKSNVDENHLNEKIDDVVNKYFRQIISDGPMLKDNFKMQSLLESFNINQMTDFVLENHEIVYGTLLNIDINNKSKSYNRCVDDARREGYYFNDREGTVDLYQSLSIMMNCRNALSHPKNKSKTRKKFLGILYALLFFETWAKIHQEN